MAGANQAPVFFMKDILNRLLGKRNLKVEELDKEERKTFEEWDKVLSKEELTTQDIKIFCQQYLDKIETLWADYGIEQSSKAELIPYHSFCKTILKVVDSPKAQREALERHLEQLLK